ncbi:MAG TPA: peptidoglycan-binding protein [bacterium]|nr:peptidoglycan-binding protein [bacterium]
MNTNTKGLFKSLLLVGAFILMSVLPANALILQWNLTYYAGDHGVIVGDGSQIVLDGADGTPVGVTADADYFFYRWSDGNTDNPRTDLGVTEDITVTAEYLPNVPSSVYVDDDYTALGANDGHIWGYDAFDNIPDALLNVGPGATIHVADGTYEYDTTINLDIPDLTITGPTPVDMMTLPIVRNYNCLTVFAVQADNVSIIGLGLEHNITTAPGNYCYAQPVINVGAFPGTTIESNDIAGGAMGISFVELGSGGIVSNNLIHDNEYNGVDLWNGAYSVSGNEFYNNTWGIGMACNPGLCGGSYDFSGTNISGNNIYNNANGGIIFAGGDQMSAVTIGPNNDIYDQLENISIFTNANNLSITGNKIHDSINVTTGLHIENNEGIVNAKNNWWGSDSGPNISGVWEGSGDTITPPDADTSVFYRPFCTVEDCTEASTLEIDPTALEDNFTSGTFAIVGTDYTNTSQIMVTEELTIAVTDGDGTSKVILPSGTIITKIGGGNIDGSLLEASELDEATVTGLASGDVVYGALNWGIPSLGLQFSMPITIKIYIGTDLYNQTLDIKRSTDGITWTSDGIVSPATCVVDIDGMCTFQATKASSYIGYDEYELPETPHSPTGNVGPISIAYNNPTPTGDGETSQTVGMGQSVSVGTLSTEGLNLFAYVDSVAHFKALHSSTYTYGEHTMTITGLDMAQQIVSFKIESDPQYFSLTLGNETQVDLDGDNIKDIKVKFSALSVNRIEMTLKSLLTKTGTVSGDATTPTQTKLCAYTFTRDLSAGMSGADVKELQKCLNSIGYTLAASGATSPGWETSFFGSLTKAGITRFQQANGLTVNGMLDAATRAKLNGPSVAPTTPTGKYMFTRNLYLGMSGDDIKELQKFLNNKGYQVASVGAGSPGNETMFYGYATRAAVMKFQSANGISPVGYVGALTRAALNK